MTKPDEVNIRPATSGDVSSMITLDRECPTAAHWTEQHYRSLFVARAGKLESLVLIVEEMADAPKSSESPTMLGFLVAQRVDYEWELQNIVVAPSARRKGLGKRLLEGLLDRAAQANRAVFLEVRESNTAARKLYEKAGFELSGRRKSYYINPSEDAAVYRHNRHTLG